MLETWYKKEQDLLLRLLNTDAGRYLLGLKKDDFNTIICVKSNGFVVSTGEKLKNKPVFQAHIFNGDGIEKRIGSIFAKWELARYKYFEEIIESPYRAFLHFADFEKNSSLPFYALDLVTIDATSDSTGILYFGATTFANARTGADGTLEVNASRIAATKVTAVNWDVSRQFCFFDATTLVPAGSTVSGVTFRHQRYTTRNDTDTVDLDIVAHTATVPVNSNTDFNAIGTTVFGNVAFSALSNSAETDIILDANGISAFLPGVINKYGKRVSRDTDNVDPTGTNNLDSDATLQDLIVTFISPSTDDFAYFL